MKIRLLSDLHLEGRQGYEKKPLIGSKYAGEDVLVLAGDIAVGVDEVVKALQYFKAQGFPHIIYVAGNHEYYHHDYADHVQLRILVKQLENVHMLDASEVVKIGDVSFFGGTLWTNFSNDPISQMAAQNGINDFRVIKGWDTEKCKAEFYRQSQFIKYTYENTPGKKCIVTHFLPARECVAARYKSEGTVILLNDYFANNLGDWISTLSDTTWMFGHTHDSMDFLIGDTRVISNPLGYARESIPEFAAFNPTKVVEI